MQKIRRIFFMTLSIRCSMCSNIYRKKWGRIGSSSKCPYCGHNFTVTPDSIVKFNKRARIKNIIEVEDGKL